MLEVPEVPDDAPMTIDESNGTHWRPSPNGAHLMRPDPEEPAMEAMEDVPTQESFAFELLDPGSPFAAARLAPFWRDVWARGAGPWLLKAGQYDLTPDHRPLLGPTCVEGLHLNCGHSGHGVMASVGAGRRVVDLILGRLDPEVNPFRVGRSMPTRDRDVL
jgi:sarcosine oxidase subunit beta